jgi:antitoxin (DNA-binding transcriptional repressor) of toxin-antitoxin stability system
MRSVRIVELESRLGEYLRVVRHGETIAVLDRETPVSQIVAVRERVASRIRRPPPGRRLGSRQAAEASEARLRHRPR